MFIIRGLRELENDLSKAKSSFEWKGKPEQITKFTENELAGKQLRPPEDFYFEGAEGKTLHGYVVKPQGWKAGNSKKWPVLLLIHGGTSFLTCLTDNVEEKLRSPGSMG